MSREVDKRDPHHRRATPAREAELRSATAATSDQLPGRHRIRVTRMDERSGNPATIISEAAPARPGDYIRRALEHVQGISRALGFDATQASEYIPDPNYQTASSGAVAVHMQQQLKGIPIFGATETVRFDPDGRITETTGSSVTLDQNAPLMLQISVREAVLTAARHVAVPDTDEPGETDQFGEPVKLSRVDLSGFEADIIASFPEKPERPTVIEAGPFQDSIKASLLWFPLDDLLRLTWQVLITLPDYQGQYRTLVDTRTGEILYCKQQLQFIAARGNVYRVDGRSARELTDFPLALNDYNLSLPADLPAGFPDDWVESDRTIGNPVNAHLGVSGPPSQGTPQGGVVTFDPVNAQGDDQKVLNIFYYNCFMHDFFYLLGFREADGNFQNDNLGRSGRALDRVDARAHSGAVQGTANMATPADGSGPVMNMGLVTSTNRHTAFDSSVVYHEFTHGVSNRLVGGPANAFALEEAQSGGMGEGWSDYIACTINDTIVVGDWVVNNPNGIRGFHYDSNYPDNFGDLGSGRYDGSAPHPIGEIWCATLLEMNRNIGSALGAQLVVDGLKLTRANPGFLDARDGILAALDALLNGDRIAAADYNIALDGIWQAFAHFGMGPQARSNGPFLNGIVADFNPSVSASPEPEPTPLPVPGGADVLLETSPNLAIPDNRATGVSSILNVTQAGKIADLSVFVDIKHTFIGDLRVRLISPAGTVAVLHDRNGGGGDDLAATYHSADVPALGALLNEDAQGSWTLQIADLAAADFGTLRRWSLIMKLAAAAQPVRGEAVPGLSIPDNHPAGISSSIAITSSGTVHQIRVSVDITHTYIGDLRVTLIAPGGERALLHDRFGGSADNLIRSYDSLTSAVLHTFIGRPVGGNWTLQVADLAGVDIGKLNRWQLEIDV